VTLYPLRLCQIDEDMVSWTKLASKKEPEAMRLQGPRVSIRPMRRSDLNTMVQWRPFADPLYQPFDFPRRSLTEHIHWFNWRSQDTSRRLYVIEDEECEIIGSLTLREIDGQRSARLGITIGADYVSQGYGSEALRLFLDYYFGEMGFARLILDVAATNLRAVRCYQALGFRQVGQHYRPASHPSFRVLREEPRYQHLLGFFRRQGTSYQVLFYDMALTREEWWMLSQDWDDS
jgi:RimJ/RimL family protein N-acetyltransferase